MFMFLLPFSPLLLLSVTSYGMGYALWSLKVCAQTWGLGLLERASESQHISATANTWHGVKATSEECSTHGLLWGK